jgi:hypothetical protein
MSLEYLCFVSGEEKNKTLMDNLKPVFGVAHKSLLAMMRKERRRGQRGIYTALATNQTYLTNSACW